MIFDFLKVIKTQENCKIFNKTLINYSKFC